MDKQRSENFQQADKACSVSVFKVTFFTLLCFLCAGCIDTSAQQAAVVAAPEPPALSAVKNYYQAIIDKNCLDTIKIRPGYSVARCQNIESLAVQHIGMKVQSERAATVAVDINYRVKHTEPATFSGLVLVKNIGGQWLIQEHIESYAQLDGMTPEAFLAKYVLAAPEGVLQGDAGRVVE